MEHIFIPVSLSMVYLLLDSMAFGQGSLVRLNWFPVSMIGQNQWTEISVLTL